jgi:hypothetical protein
MAVYPTQSPIVNEWIEATTLGSTRDLLVRFVRGRWPGALSQETLTTITEQPSLEILGDWVDQAATAQTIEEFDAYLRR